MSPLTSHVLDTATGRPAAGMALRIERLIGTTWSPIASGTTNDDGRVPGLLQAGELKRGDYRAIFETGTWLEEQGSPIFYPQVTVAFRVSQSEQHHHIPLLLSPFGYSTYRGS